jgi:hypothetical protein
MNIPNKIIANKIFEYLNFNFAKANPFKDPINEEIIVAGIVRYKLFNKLGDNFLKASANPYQEKLVGKSHI